ncbi:hypothetical protein [Mesorhizobium sp.]|uniref:hypothetical protein n=1 Tax=Mesorhizobium sp. TaxID=1871066 RepID=UPI00120E9A83|nr:hypothetical protein [Mesorhizobium sp.]TIO26947.1 MAG: hypothetical protein E5X83_06410 [Mesorhizobium sp.]
MSAAAEKTTFADLEPLICDADNMADVLLTMLEVFSTVPDGNFVLTQGEGERLYFVASVLGSMTMKAKAAYYEAIKGKVSSH